MSFYTDPFFWALVSLLGLQGAGLVASGHRIGRNLLFTSLMLTFVTVGRVLLVMPLCPQPRHPQLLYREIDTLRSGPIDWYGDRSGRAGILCCLDLRNSI